MSMASTTNNGLRRMARPVHRLSWAPFRDTLKFGCIVVIAKLFQGVPVSSIHVVKIYRRKKCVLA